jgi:hypothetical protein
MSQAEGSICHGLAYPSEVEADDDEQHEGRRYDQSHENHADSRIGVVKHPGEADVLMGGFIRHSGPLVPLDLARATDEGGSPIGSRLLVGIEHLNPDDQRTFERLAGQFRFKDVVAVQDGNSQSNANRFIKKCESLRIVRKDGKGYTKASVSGVDQVERME